jgi:hypothetical protein
MFIKHFQISLLLLVMALPAQASVFISVTPNKTDLHVGDTVSLSIHISELSDDVALSSYDLSLGFDPAFLQFDSAIFGDPSLGDQLDIAGLGLNFPSALAGVDLVSLIEFSWDDSQTLLGQQAKNFTIASLFFTAISPGSSPLNLTINSLADHDSIPLIADSNSSSVSIAAVPIPSAIWMFVPALAWVMRRRGNLNS